MLTQTHLHAFDPKWCTIDSLRVFHVEAEWLAKVKVQSLVECPGWNSCRLKKVTAANINSGLVEGFVSIQKK